MKDLLQFKSFEIKSYKEEDDGFVVEGYGAVFNNIDSVGDVIEKGAFAKTLQERGDRIAFCLQHNIHEPIGKIVEIKEDETGLWLKCRISKSEPGIATKIKEGILKEMSIGYRTINSKNEIMNGQEVQKLTEIKLFEISLVTIAANPLAVVTGMKADEVNSHFDDEFTRLIGLTRSSEIKFELMKLHGQVKALIEDMEPEKPTPTPEPEPLKSEIVLKTFKF
jgi:HK97 family phage prohead protease